MLKQRRFMLRWSLAFSITATLVAFLLPETFESAISFRPEASPGELNVPRNLVGLASQFGVAIGGGTGDSPQFYANVLTSRTLRDEILVQQFRDPRSQLDGDSVSLLDVLEITGDSLGERLFNGRKELEDIVSIDVDRLVGVVTVRVRTRYPQLSADVGNALVQALNGFNMRTRSSSARALREFTEAQVAESERDLHNSEDKLQFFLQENRNFQNSPALRAQYERLQRQVTMKEGVFVSLRQQYDQARIQEVNNTPVITVIDTAAPAEERASPRRTLIVTTAFLMGLGLAATIAFAREYVSRAAERGETGARDLSETWQQTRSQIRRLLHRTSKTG